MKTSCLHKAMFGMLLFVVASCASNDGNEAKPNKNDPNPKIVLLYVSDLHSQLLPSSDGLGGYARLKQLIDQERLNAGPKTDVMLVFGGDVFGKGRMPCRKTDEEACAPITGFLNPDVVTFGNGELKFRHAKLEQLAKKIGGTWVGSDVDSAHKKSTFWKPAHMFHGKKSGMKLQFVSTTVFPGPGETKGSSKPDFVPSARPFSDLYKSQLSAHPEYQPILVLHDDLKRLEELKSELCSSSGFAPLIVLKAHEHKVNQGQKGCLKYVEAGSFGRQLARIEITGSPGQLKVKNINIKDVNQSVIDEPIMKAKITNLYQVYSKEAHRKMLELKTEVPVERVAKFLAMSYQKTSKADIAIVNSGAIKEGFPKGVVDWETVLTSVPYNNELMGLDWSLSDLEKSLCQASRRSKDRRLDNGSDLILYGAELQNPGASNCKLVVKSQKRMPKVVVDSYLVTRSERWLGKEIKGKAFSYGLDTERALELGIERYGKSEF